MSYYHERPEVRLLKALTAANPTLIYPLTPELVELVDPESYTQGANNTRVLLRARTGADIVVGSTMVQYTRWTLSTLLTGLSVPGVGSDYSDGRQALQAVLQHYRLPLTPADFQIAELQADGLGLQAAAGSLAVIGQYTLPFTA
jgi:hypothetical protein